MTIRWVSAFLEFPESLLERGTAFWKDIACSHLSPHTDRFGASTILQPADGDPHLGIRQTTAGTGGVQLVVHVDDMTQFVGRVGELGATIDTDPEISLALSPGGFAFCIVHDAEVGDLASVASSTLTRSSPIVGDPLWAGQIDQLCLDVPEHLFERETAFWAAATGWEMLSSPVRPEFVALTSNPRLPLRLLIQRLEATDPATSTRAHIDIACNGHLDQVTLHHVELGATVQRVETYWTTLTDPTGLEYCLTKRDPIGDAARPSEG